jgi:hypothetical protein
MARKKYGTFIQPVAGDANIATIYNVTMAAANTEYLQQLPADVKRFSLQCQGAFDMRFAFETGRVAAPTRPYGIVKSGTNYYEDLINVAGLVVYFATAEAGQVAEIIAWR